MSDDELGAEEQAKEIPGEGFPLELLPKLPIEEVIVEKELTFEDASKCLNTLGKDESGVRYAYLMITATDRKLTSINVILNFKHVFFVDVSGNYLNLDALQVLEQMPFMILLKAERNRVESAALLQMAYLQVLGLSRNEIMETNNIEQPLLECLELSYNQICTVQFVAERLPTLKQLDMRGNYLPDISGSFPLTVKRLYLAENRISKIITNDLAKLVHLKILHLRENFIRKLNGFSASLVSLTYLNLRKNKITKFRQFRKLSCLPRLETLIVLQNPVAGDVEEKLPGEGGGEDAEDEEEQEKEDITRIPILVLLPHLKRINKGVVTLEEREELAEVREEKLEEIMGEESSEDETEPATTTDFTTEYSTDGGEDLTDDEENA